MSKVRPESKKEIVQLHIQEGRTLSSLAAEYGVSTATISNWVRAYREECQTNEEAMNQLELMQEIRKLRQEKAELEKENLFLKKQRHSLRRKSISGISVHRNSRKGFRITVAPEADEDLSQRILQLSETSESSISEEKRSSFQGDQNDLPRVWRNPGLP